MAIRSIRSLTVASLLSAVVVLALFPASFAQSSIDEVHVVPRVAVESPTREIDASLDAHTKPIKKEVDLVLVPVTITDPMDRLVIGLEQDNFQVFDGKQPQEIKHFSSEDTPVSLGVIFDMSGVALLISVLPRLAKVALVGAIIVVMILSERETAECQYHGNC